MLSSDGLGKYQASAFLSVVSIGDEMTLCFPFGRNHVSEYSVVYTLYCLSDYSNGVVYHDMILDSIF